MGGGHKEDADPDQRAQVAGGPADRSLSEKTAGEDGGEGGRHTASSSRDAGKTKNRTENAVFITSLQIDVFSLAGQHEL